MKAVDLAESDDGEPSSSTSSMNVLMRFLTARAAVSHPP